ncbi:hypothetical protein L484_025624 [Morus notabilis]|uniref:Uncharacterized protein n=1 Tax=Morus notabilis TaxID=981085 RepID=W9RGZ1_9ROSA|nr:hypothetical protein L484_025624 [Morus notabilis]
MVRKLRRKWRLRNVGGENGTKWRIEIEWINGGFISFVCSKTSYAASFWKVCAGLRLTPS